MSFSFKNNILKKSIVDAIPHLNNKKYICYYISERCRGQFYNNHIKYYLPNSIDNESEAQKE